MKTLLRATAILSAMLSLAACSTTKVLKEGEYRLVGTDIEIDGKKSGAEVPVSAINSCITQQSGTFLGSWNPLVSIYNWSGGSDKGLGSLWKKLGQEPVVFSQSAMQNSAANMERKLESMGYYNSKVQAEVEKSGKKAKVTYYVKTGRRYIIDDIRYTLPAGEEFAADFRADTANVSLKRGDILCQEGLNAEIERSMSQLRRKGYFALDKGCYSFVADTLGKTGHVSLEYIVSEGEMPLKKVQIGSVGVSYPSDFNIRTSVIKGMNLVKPGQTYDSRVVENTYSRFASLRMFSSVGVEMNQTSPDKVDCEISLTPSKQQGFKTSIEASTNSSGLIGISPQLTFYNKNFFHGGEWLNVGFSGNFQFMLNSDTRANEFGVSTNLSLPRFLGLSYRHFQGPNIPRTEFGASYNYQNRPEYHRNIISTTYGYTGRVGKHHYQIYPLELSYVRLFEMDDRFKSILANNKWLQYSYEDHFDAGIGGTLMFASSTDAVQKGDYRSSRLNFNVSGNVVSLFDPLLSRNSSGQGMLLGAPYAQYALAEFSHSRGVQFGPEEHQVIAWRVVAGFGHAYGNSETLPYEKQFYCGGSSSMRGWQARALGPGFDPLETSFSIPSQTGDMKFEADVEFRFPMFWKVEGAAFAEVGNVWNLVQGYTVQKMLGSLAADWGFGIRANFDLLLLRVDLGLQMRDPSEQIWIMPLEALQTRRFALHFGVGYPF